MITNWHALSLRDHVHTQHGASDDTASKLRSVIRLPPPPHEVLHFSCMKSPENVLCPVTFFGAKISMLSAPFIDGSPYLFYTKNICHLYSLFAPIKTIVNSFQNLTLPHDLKEDYPNGNLILREDYQKSFKKEVRWRDIKSFLKTESIGEVYPNYSNGEKDRYVFRPSRQNGVHDGIDRRK